MAFWFFWALVLGSADKENGYHNHPNHQAYIVAAWAFEGTWEVNRSEKADTKLVVDPF